MLLRFEFRGEHTAVPVPFHGGCHADQEPVEGICKAQIQVGFGDVKKVGAMQNLLQLSTLLERRADDVMIGVLEANGSVHADVATADHSKLLITRLVKLLTALDLRSVQRCLRSVPVPVDADAVLAMIGRRQRSQLMDQDQQSQLERLRIVLDVARRNGNQLFIENIERRSLPSSVALVLPSLRSI